MLKEFNKIEDIYTPPDSTGKQKLLSKNLISKIILETNQIQPSEFINQKGKIVKNKCTVKYLGEYIILNHSYEEVKKLVINTDINYPKQIIIKGFRK